MGPTCAGVPVTSYAERIPLRDPPQGKSRAANALACCPAAVVDAGKTKAAAPAAAKNNKSDEADVTAPPGPAPRDPKPPPVFVQNKDRWTELRKRCANKNI
ncbi:hypothetical protein EVAR_98655_1 [Eumeta japonica]|uniref:Uncharacterized protein n=1 Tax=Eumeta variegata TaxID=151549 RepID=A0A4C1XUP1_EUMVA|nr:hypothetical protein EVAR_98655_1 [Eumeta japonica]